MERKFFSVMLVAAVIFSAVPAASAMWGLNKNKVCGLKVYVYETAVWVDNYPSYSYYVYSNPIAGAAVTVQGQTILTDENGLAYFETIVNDRQMTPYTVAKEGFEGYSGSALTCCQTTPAPRYKLTYETSCVLTPLP